jgi:hypothetical protein
MALGMGVQDIIWMTEWLFEVGVRLTSPVNLLCDNTGAVAMSKSLISRRANRHTRVKYHLIREAVSDNTVKVVSVGASEMWADYLTKSSMTKEGFIGCRDKIQGYQYSERSGSIDMLGAWFNWKR